MYGAVEVKLHTFLTSASPPMGQQPLLGQGILIIKASRSPSDTTVGRNPLDEWSARRKDLCLITHNTQKRQTSKTHEGF